MPKLKSSVYLINISFTIIRKIRNGCCGPSPSRPFPFFQTIQNRSKRLPPSHPTPSLPQISHTVSECSSRTRKDIPPPQCYPARREISSPHHPRIRKSTQSEPKFKSRGQAATKAKEWRSPFPNPSAPSQPPQIHHPSSRRFSPVP